MKSHFIKTIIAKKRRKLYDSLMTLLSTDISADISTDALLHRMEHHELPVVDLSLERVRRFPERIGNPHRQLPPVVHVAGTNGKGSLIAYLHSIFAQAGYRVHVYTSPHLVRFHERIVLAGEEISDAALNTLLREVLEKSRDFPLTYFESTTMAAFLGFAQTPADVLLLETGLGGRLDATNIVEQPELTVITPVSRDHMDFLGDDLAGIAAEKAGIIKPGVPCVVGKQPEEVRQVILARAAELEAPCFVEGRDWRLTMQGEYHSADRKIADIVPALPGAHQYDNAALAIACCEMLSRYTLNEENIRQGIAQAVWPARLQLLREGLLVEMAGEGRALWLDGGHNEAAASVIANWCQERAQPVHLILGMLKNKDAEAYLSLLQPHLISVTCIPVPDTDSCFPPESLAEIAGHLGISASVAASEEAAMKALCAPLVTPEDILIAGSLYLAGSVLESHA